MKFASTSIMLALPFGAAAFAPMSSKMLSAQIKHETGACGPLYYTQEKFERAVDCAEHYGMCDVNELEHLAKELEDMQGKTFFEGERDTELRGRKDLRETLLLQRELQSKNLNDNTFVRGVKEMRERSFSVDE
eukprot:CAMPEP_0185728544 /NCGR_PEP_ID=MMETSP1171-20130828/3840_1 /TAXON_ID=374046 /ORGANISM="Helicotheca tamensis, Strain CCMP826" /LENGTH=132 /DNA_ID=CAMNT_0028397265 /DNA_START=106 /DNA_END=504 /DNA_ORIENTATION=-